MTNNNVWTCVGQVDEFHPFCPFATRHEDRAKVHDNIPGHQVVNEDTSRWPLSALQVAVLQDEDKAEPPIQRIVMMTGIEALNIFYKEVKSHNLMTAALIADDIIMLALYSASQDQDSWLAKEKVRHLCHTTSILPPELIQLRNTALDELGYSR